MALWVDTAPWVCMLVVVDDKSSGLVCAGRDRRAEPTLLVIEEFGKAMRIALLKSLMALLTSGAGVFKSHRQPRTSRASFSGHPTVSEASTARA